MYEPHDRDDVHEIVRACLCLRLTTIYDTRKAVDRDLREFAANFGIRYWHRPEGSRADAESYDAQFGVVFIAPEVGSQPLGTRLS